MRDGDPANGENWTLRCRVCAHNFPPDITMGVVAAHWNLHDGVEENAPELDLVWIGFGPPPPAEDAPL